MEHKEQHYSDIEDIREESTINLKSVWMSFIANRYWFAVSFVICMLGAWTYLHFATPVFRMTSKVLIKDKDDNRRSSKTINLSEIGFANNSSGFDNEVEVLGSENLARLVVYDLKLYTQYWVKTSLKSIEVGRARVPYLVDADSSVLNDMRHPITFDFNVESGTSASVFVKCDEFEKELVLSHLPQQVETPEGRVVIYKNEKYHPATEDEHPASKFRAVIHNIDNATTACMAQFNVEPTSKNTTIAQLTFVDNLPQRGIDYLNYLVSIYNREANYDYNLEAKYTAEFIDERLSMISNELSSVEGEMENYKKQNKISEYLEDVRSNSAQSAQYDAKLVELTTQLSLIKYLIEYINDPKHNMQSIPVNIGVSDMGIVSMIADYNKALVERNRLLNTASQNNPAVEDRTSIVLSLKENVKTTLVSAQHELQIKERDIRQQLLRFEGSLTSSASKERGLAEIARQQELKAGLYVVLLQKREENLISLASSVSKAKEIEKPKSRGIISPKPRVIYPLAFILAFLIPFLCIYLIKFFRYRISSIEDIEEQTSIPVFGIVPYIKALNTGLRTIVLQENRNSVIMETYRLLRSTLPFVLRQNENVILFTSCVPGEGKTCIACNFATSIAFTGKRVLVMGMDIRKPRLAQLFNLNEDAAGISNFLCHDPNDTSYLDSLIVKTDVSSNLDVLPAGPVPPNPTELLATQNMRIAIDYLKQKYDFVILDTAPIGVVSDTLSLTKLADITFYVVRSNFSLKNDMQLINHYYEQNMFNKINIILNAVSIKKEDTVSKRYGKYSSHYGNSYGYGYGYGYGGSEKLEEV